MKKSLLIAFNAIVIGLFAASNSPAGVIPPNLPAGSQYQLIFVTSGTDTAASSNIVDYNTFVINQAGLSLSLPATTWHAIASTASVNANVNAPWVSGLPVYNTQGIEVASPTSGLYSGSLLAAVMYDQNGGFQQSLVWTGSGGTGTASQHPVGSTTPGFGSAFAHNLDWIQDSGSTTQTLLPLYALSGAITAVPEPSALCLMGFATLITFGARTRQTKSA